MIEHFEHHKLQWVTRLKLNRWVQLKNKKGGDIEVQTERVNRHINLPFKAQITKIEDGKESIINIQYGITRCSIKDIPNKKFSLLVIEEFAQKPMILITNIQANKNDPKEVYRILEIYLTRWKCDECYRYIKQSYNLEDIRVRSYTSIRNTIILVHAIAYFTSIYMGINLKLKLMVNKIFVLSKRFFGIPSFYNYAMADGIYELLKKATTGINTTLKNHPSMQSCQLNIFDE